MRGAHRWPAAARAWDREPIHRQAKAGRGVPQRSRRQWSACVGEAALADIPLWNAEKVRGNIVAIVRGPAAPATAVSYGLKMYHAQLAGAKAVIFVDYDPNGKFDAMPRIDEGVVQYGVRPTPADVDIRISIPAVLVLNRHTSQLQEGAHHVLAFAPPGFPGIPFGWKVGFVCVPPQESKAVSYTHLTLPTN